MKACKISLAVLLSLFLCSKIVEAQRLLPLNNTYQHIYQDFYYFSGEWKNANIKPIMQVNNLPKDTSDIMLCEISSGNSYIKRKLYKEAFINIEKDDYRIKIDPLFDFSMGVSNMQAYYLYNNIRGIQIEIDIANKISLHSDIYEAQSIFQEYSTNFIRNNGVVNGSINPKLFKQNSYDYTTATGYVSINPTDFFNIQFGNSKHFWGDGYRSLFLSDNSFQYTNLKFDYNQNGLRYIWMLAVMQNPNFNNVYKQNIPRSNWGAYQKKAASFFYLSKTFGNNFRIGLFESIIWEANTSAFSSLDAGYIVPLIGVNSFIRSLRDENNSRLGLDITYKIGFDNFIYSQFLIDDIKTKVKSNSNFYYAFQIGCKTRIFDNLHLRLESNIVSPYMYNHQTGTQSYTHYNQAIAHPLGANFIELLAQTSYNYKRFYIQLLYMYALQGSDGSYIYTMSYQSLLDKKELLDGERRDVHHLNLDISYLMNKNTNLNVFINMGLRQERSDIDLIKEFYISGGIRTSLTNKLFIY